jgi:rhodanese-related sulfurtransferase
MTMARRLGIGAVAFGLAAPFAGSPYRSPQDRMDLESVLSAIQNGSDHVSARQLAAWIRDRKPGLRVIDVRPAGSFKDYSIPTAENMPIERLTKSAFAHGETIVLYSEEGAHAGQAWVILRALGVHEAVFVPGGLADWRDEVMQPVLGPGLSPVERSEIVELSRYFGGAPRFAPAGEMNSDLPSSLRRRGC